MKKLAVVGLVLLAAFLTVAWIRGGAQPMHWIEQPLQPGASAGMKQ
ncbi:MULTISPECIES: hypothetical protein [unclassified Novosphingobium]|nr:MULTISPECIES: hypothetical protein [unclassified Novosphingobium]